MSLPVLIGPAIEDVPPDGGGWVCKGGYYVLHLCKYG